MRIRDVSAAPLRWGKGVKGIAVGWLVVLFSAWLHGEIATGFAYGAMASGVLWTLGSFLESAEASYPRHLSACFTPLPL